VHVKIHCHCQKENVLSSKKGNSPIVFRSKRYLSLPHNIILVIISKEEEGKRRRRNRYKKIL